MTWESRTSSASSYEVFIFVWSRPVNVPSHPEIPNFGHPAWSFAGEEAVPSGDVPEGRHKNQLISVLTGKKTPTRKQLNTITIQKKDMEMFVCCWVTSKQKKVALNSALHCYFIGLKHHHDKVIVQTHLNWELFRTRPFTVYSYFYRSLKSNFSPFKAVTKGQLFLSLFRKRTQTKTSLLQN